MHRARIYVASDIDRRLVKRAHACTVGHRSAVRHLAIWTHVGGHVPAGPKNFYVRHRKECRNAQIRSERTQGSIASPIHHQPLRLPCPFAPCEYPITPVGTCKLHDGVHVSRAFKATSSTSTCGLTVPLPALTTLPLRAVSSRDQEKHLTLTLQSAMAYES